MRILWVTQNGGNYKNPTVTGTGGWIGAMQEAFCKRNPEIELGVAFFHPTDSEEIKTGNVTYLPVEYDYGKTMFNKWVFRHFRNEDEYLSERVKKLYRVVSSFKPDIVHVWGIELKHSQIINYLLDIPYVVHIQGLASAYLYTHFAPGFSTESLKSADTFFDRVILKRGDTFEYREFVARAKRELLLMPKVKNWIGRTEWDKTISNLFSPSSTYFHCDELLRSSFSESKWEYHYDGKTIHLQTTISCDWYKGMDVVLNTAAVLKNLGFDICWNIFGWEKDTRKIREIVKVLNVQPEEVGVHLMGCVDASEIIKGLLACDCYVHTSYIENSSNAIAEAQLIGVPVIAQNGGGTASMLKNNSGVLVNLNEPFIMAAKILEMRRKDVAEFYSLNARELAYKRHNPDTVCKNLMNIYKAILNIEN